MNTAIIQLTDNLLAIDIPVEAVDVLIHDDNTIMWAHTSERKAYTAHDLPPGEWFIKGRAKDHEMWSLEKVKGQWVTLTTLLKDIDTNVLLIERI